MSSNEEFMLDKRRQNYIQCIHWRYSVLIPKNDSWFQLELSEADCIPNI